MYSNLTWFKPVDKTTAFLCAAAASKVRRCFFTESVPASDSPACLTHCSPAHLFNLVTPAAALPCSSEISICPECCLRTSYQKSKHSCWTGRLFAMLGAGTSLSGLLASTTQCSEQESLLNCCSVQSISVMPKVPAILMVEKHNWGPAFLHLPSFACPLERTPEGNTRILGGACHQDWWEAWLGQLLVGTETRQLQQTSGCHDCLAAWPRHLDLQRQRAHSRAPSRQAQLGCPTPHARAESGGAHRQ